jgi:hypothetical protein
VRRTKEEPLITSCTTGTYLHSEIQYVPQLIDICFAPRRRQDTFFRERMQLAHVARQNRVPTRQTSVGGKDAIVCTRHGSGGASVKFVRTEAVLVGLLCHAVVRVVLRVRGVDGAFGRTHQW